MPATEIITIINNSGKVISTGKQLVSIFKEAKAAYRDKRESIKAERGGPVPGIQRAKTFDVPPRAYVEEYDEQESDIFYERPRAIRDVPHDARSRAIPDDMRSRASSHRSHRTARTRARSSSRDRGEARPALTLANLKTHTEVSAVPPSRAPTVVRERGAGGADMQLATRPALNHAATMPAAVAGPSTVVSTPRQSMLVHRPRSDPALQQQPKRKEIDMHLAYGNVPPDLASRVDLDTGHSHSHPATRSGEFAGAEEDQEKEAMNIINRIEGLLDEAHCVQHTASSMIAHLQQKPEAAAAVALTLAELSALIGKMSPAFLGVLKGSSPAIFALLASPQFLIGTGIAVGVTVVMFGGWKIVKKLGQKEKEAAFEMKSMPAAEGAPTVAPQGDGASYDEALVIEEELSTIESWRRGIPPSGVGLDEDEESADVELISPEADRALRELDELDPFDSVSNAGRSVRSRRSHRSHRSRRHREDVDVPERKSSRKYHEEGATASEVAESVRSHRSHRSHRSERTERTERPERSDRSSVSKASKRSSRTEVKPIEEEKEEEEVKKKKGNMLKQLFKKKEKEHKEKEGSRAMSVMV
ncbi:hypothetical protein OQA88_2481 [Cercophora sp. LCS_1]